MKVTKIEAGRYETDNGYYISKHTPQNIWTGRPMSSREVRWHIYDKEHNRVGWTFTLKEAKELVINIDGADK